MRIGLVGYGKIAPRHREVLEALGASIVGACVRSDAGRARALDAGIPRAYANVEELVAGARPEALVCCVSFPSMGAVAREVLAFGLPTLLEKPPGTSLAELESLVAAAGASNAPVMVALNRRHYSVVERALDHAGGREAVTAVSLSWSEDPATFLARGYSRAEVERLVFANSLHGLDLMTWIAGPLPSPTVHATDRGDLRWQMALQGVAAGGALCAFESVWAAPGPWRLSFVAAGRRYTFAPLETCAVLEPGAREPVSIPPHEDDLRFKPGFLAQARAFLEMARGRTTASAHSLASVRPAMELADRLTHACLEAAR